MKENKITGITCGGVAILDFIAAIACTKSSDEQKRKYAIVPVLTGIYCVIMAIVNMVIYGYEVKNFKEDLENEVKTYQWMKDDFIDL